MRRCNPDLAARVGVGIPGVARRAAAVIRTTAAAARCKAAVGHRTGEAGRHSAAGVDRTVAAVRDSRSWAAAARMHVTERPGYAVFESGIAVLVLCPLQRPFKRVRHSREAFLQATRRQTEWGWRAPAGTGRIDEANGVTSHSTFPWSIGDNMLYMTSSIMQAGRGHGGHPVFLRAS